MNPLVLIWVARIVGVIIFAEGLANLVYWRHDTHPFIFQYGRFLRTMLGLILVTASF